MKARFYRGPWDGKIKTVPDHSYTWKVAIANTKPGWMDFPTDGYIGPDTIFPTHKMYNEYIYRRTNHTHPDGSVFFEWDQKKGSRI